MTKFHVGLVRKIGQPNFGSLAAECRLEVEIDGNLLRSPNETLPHRIQEAFNVCRREVDRELILAQTIEATASVPRFTSVNGQDRSGPAASKAKPTASRIRRATDAQVRAIHVIASKANIHLVSQLTDDFGVSAPQQLTIRQASELIEKLKGQLQA